MDCTIRIFWFRVFDGRHHLAVRLSAFCADIRPWWPACDSDLPPEYPETVKSVPLQGSRRAPCSPFWPVQRPFGGTSPGRDRAGRPARPASEFRRLRENCGGPAWILTGKPRASRALARCDETHPREAERPTRDGRAGATHRGRFHGTRLVGPPGFEPGTKGL